MIIKTFRQITKADVLEAGGKGASLGEMTQAGIPVPDGFVVLSEAFEKFLQATDLNVEIDAILHKVNHKEIHTVENASEQIRALILQAKMPQDIAREIKKHFGSLKAKYVAVRSSATAEDSSAAAWAGQLDSFLNTTEKDLLEKVQRCWASLFTPRAIFYRFEKGLHATKISVAVVVQKMIQSEVSGIAFSVHPVTQDYNQLIIEAGYGLGEAIVSGSITPDSYVVEKNNNNILDKNISDQTRALVRGKTENEWKETKNGNHQKLTDKQIIELAKLIIRIEKHYGFPCDIEWALEKSKFYIVQSRPITTLTESPNKPESSSASGVPDISNDNLIYFGQRVEPYFASAIIATGLANRENLKKVFDLNIPVRWIQVDEDFYNIKSDVTALVQEVREKLKLNGKKYVDRLLNECFIAGERLIQLAQKIEKQTTGKLSKIQMQKLLDRYYSEANKYCIYYNIAFLDKPEMEIAQSIALKYGKNQEDVKQIFDWITSPSKETAAEHEQDDFLRICIENHKTQNLKRSVANHLKNYSWLSLRFFVGSPWNEQDIIQRINSTNPQEAREFLEHRITYRKEINTELIKFFKRVSPSERELINQIRDVVFLRTQRADFLQHSSLYVQPLLHKIAKTLGVAYDEMLYFSPLELVQALANEFRLKDCLVDRQRKILVYHADDSAVIAGNTAEEYVKRRPILQKKFENTNVLEGKTAFKGVVRGKVKIVIRNEDVSKVEKGDILVSIMTTPNFIAAMEKAAAFVTNEGGITCHAAIIAREMKKPCVIGTRVATRTLKDGDMVEVDADNGIIKKLT